jgi:DNA-directed RNA polymerases I and III subunit RPAC1
LLCFVRKTNGDAWQVPTVCIEHVYIWNNDGVIVDEILAHRLGLVPLNVDPTILEMKQSSSYISLVILYVLRLTVEWAATTEQATDRNTIVFKLKVACTRKEKPPQTSTPHSDDLYVNHEVRSSHLVWEAQGEQDVMFADDPPAPTNKDIVLAKLRPGQEIEVECHAVKGAGKDHAKFSPVGAWPPWFRFPSSCF